MCKAKVTRGNGVIELKDVTLLKPVVQCSSNPLYYMHAVHLW